MERRKAFFLFSIQGKKPSPEMPVNVASSCTEGWEDELSQWHMLPSGTNWDSGGKDEGDKGYC